MVPIIFTKNIFMKKIIHIQKVIIFHSGNFISSHSFRGIFCIFIAKLLYKCFAIDSSHLQSKLRYVDFNTWEVGCKFFYSAGERYL